MPYISQGSKLAHAAEQRHVLLHPSKQPSISLCCQYNRGLHGCTCFFTMLFMQGDILAIKPSVCLALSMSSMHALQHVPGILCQTAQAVHVDVRSGLVLCMHCERCHCCSAVIRDCHKRHRYRRTAGLGSLWCCQYMDASSTAS